MLSSKSNRTVQTYRNLYSLPIEIKYLTPLKLLLYLYYIAFTSLENSCFFFVTVLL